MPNTILQDQESDTIIRYLKAQRKAYSEGKFVNAVEWIVKVVSLLVPILLILQFNDIRKRWAWIASACLLLVFLALLFYRRNRKRVAARIQEYIDTRLFKIPWNEVQCGRTVEVEVVNNFARGESEEGLRKWYSASITSNLSHYVAALLCQYTNVSWGRELRKKYINFLIFITCVYVVTLVTLSWIEQLLVWQAASYFAPSLTAFAFTLQQIVAQSDLNRSKSRVKNFIEDELKNAKGREVKDEDTCELSQNLRNIQNTIFEQRASSASVPDWFYRFHKDRMEMSTDENIANIIQRYHLDQ